MSQTIKTSDQNWVSNVLCCYRDGIAFDFVDDLGKGIGANALISGITLIKACYDLKICTGRQIVTILACMGISGMGVWMILAAIADPEPTSKLGILLAGGVVLTLTGSIGILRALGQDFHVTAGSGKNYISVRPC